MGGHAFLMPMHPSVHLPRFSQDLTEEELTTLREEVDKYTVEGDLRRFNALNIKRLKEIGCYRGRRHYNNLPVRRLGCGCGCVSMVGGALHAACHGGAAQAVATAATWWWGPLYRSFSILRLAARSCMVLRLGVAA